MADGDPTNQNVIVKGIVEPFAKRSVEGDLGLRYGMPTLIEAAGIERVAAEAKVTVAEVEDWRKRCGADQGTLASNPQEKNIDDSLAALAVELGVMRHCGTVESIFTPLGETFIQEGKDLGDVKYIIGAGGPVIGSLDPGAVLKKACANVRNPFSLMPKNPKILVDSSYIFFGDGPAFKGSS